MSESSPLKKISQSLNGLKKSGFFNIFSATIINSIVTFIYGIFIIRVLSKNEYGVFSYVQNITNFGVLFCGMGLNLGVLQFCSENIDADKKNSYSRFAVIFGSVSSIITTVFMIMYTFIDGSGTENLTGYVIEFSLLPILYFLKDWIVSNLRWQLKNKEYANVLNVHSVANALFAVIGAILGGIHGVIFGICLAYALSVALGCYYLHQSRAFQLRSTVSLDGYLIKRFLKYSVTMCVVNALISVLYTIDLFVIGNIMQDSEKVAMYKTACVIPFALNMIPNSIMTFVYPHIAKKKEDKEWLRKYIRLIYFANGVLNLLIGVGLYIFAPIVINILFGNKYEGILPVFRILIISYIISASLRTPASNLFGILRKAKTALVISAGTVLISVCLSIFFVTRFGIIGAAYSSVSTFGIIGVISTVILYYDIYIKK